MVRVAVWLYLSIMFVASAWAHFPDGALYRAFCFPDHAAPVIDGDLADWAPVGAVYTLATDDLVDLVTGAQPTDRDLSVRLQIGWSRAANSVYVGARVYDDIHQIDRPAGSAGTRIFQDDALEIFIDADHSGGQYADFSDLDPESALEENGTQASHFVVAGPPPDEDCFVNFSAAAWYALEDGPYTEAAYQYDAAAGVTTYEVRIVPFDHVDVNAVFLSDEHQLRAGEILGFNVEVNDFDASSELYEAKLSLSGAHNAYRFADRFTDLMLASFEGIFPTSKQSVAWGRLKAAFPD